MRLPCKAIFHAYIFDMEKDNKTKKTKGIGMEALLMIAFLVFWILLQVWILPKFGVSTWMRPGCQSADTEKKTEKAFVIDKDGSDNLFKK